MEQRRKAVICLPPGVKENPDIIVHLVPLAVEALKRGGRMDRDEIESEEVLGLEPFVLVRILNDVDGDGITVDIEYGGGLNRSGALELLEFVVEEMSKENNVG